ncbi:hypothetical protein [Streptomyces sp. NL15-2K]|uniref:hypothetical protein n=1 Tax=Streptomyces sp. NL15-2K TaxID=376149 RepID=UPI000F563C84|nr:MULTISPECIES: hypothetical protein [Actinomycetes]WKX12670.1 hypothetical protein Q4V64_36185 [Kutzneria buriramensis]GCB43118.1 hypothetical protein SNL152K_402 [Streptomyces sp. NL15-2K]
MSRTALGTGVGESAEVRRKGGVADRTAETTQWLRARRGAGRARRFAYVAYVALVLLLGWYGMFVIGLFHEIGHRRPLADSADAVARMLPSGLVFAALAGFFLTVRDALWRGPVILPRPDVDWLLALPVRRRPVLLPWFALSAGIWALAALLLGFVGVLLIAAADLGRIGLLAPACLGPAVCLALLAVVGAAVVERSRKAADRLHRATPVLLLAVLLSAVQAVAAAQGYRSKVLETVELWSGPWGWAAQPVLAAAGRSAPLWPAALALLVAATAAALVYAGKVVDEVPVAVLRSRARASGGVLAGILAVDMRSVRLSMTGGQEVRSRGRVERWAARLSPPRSPGLLVAWRDAMGLIMAPRRPGLMALLLVPAGAAAGAAAGTRGGTAYLTAALATLFGYFAASQLLEPARLDADDVRRTAWSPRPYERLALEHALVPTLVLVVTGCLLAVPVALSAHTTAPLVVLAAAPVLVAAGLLSAYRSPVPVWVLYGGPVLGDAGPILAMLWYAVGPMVGVAGLTVLLAAPFPAGIPQAADPLGRLAACWVLALLMFRWVLGRARKRVRP